MKFVTTNLLSALLLGAILLSPFAMNRCRADDKKLEGNMVLAHEGHARYVIALADDAIPSEVTAAEQLSSYLQKISGANFEVKPETEVPVAAPQILVGVGKRVKSLLPNQDWKSLETDGIVVKTLGNKLILAGGRPRGGLYAVFTFLEDTLGVRWWTPREETVPAIKTLRIGTLNTVYTPAILTREGYYHSLNNDRPFATRMKNNGNYQGQGPDWGERNIIPGWCHTFMQLLPPETYFKDHPEWYSDRNNGHKPCTKDSKMPEGHMWQLVLSNEAARLELTKNLLELIKKFPQAKIFSVSQNDSPFPAADPTNMALAAQEGSPSAPIIKFVNAVAADVEKVYPDILIDTLAYQYSQKPPRTLKPRHNVVIRLCSIEADVAHPLNSEANATFRDDVEGWRKIASHMYFWSYITNFDHPNVPFPNMRNLGPDIKFFADSKAIGLFMQGDSESISNGDFVDLRVWVVSHLMWNPALNQRKLEDEFLRGYYGAAAPHLRAYLDNVQSAFDTRPTGEKMNAFQTDYSYLSLDVLNRATRSFRLAEAAVAKDKELLARVQRERLSLDNAWLRSYRQLKDEAEKRNVVFEGPTDPAIASADFVRNAKRFGLDKITFLYTTKTVEEYAAALLQRTKPPALLPAVAAGKAPEDIIDAQENLCSLPYVGQYSELIDDDRASNGRAVRLIGPALEWSVQFTPGKDFAKLEPGPWRVYVIAKVRPKAGVTAGAAMTFGIYDNISKVERFTEQRELQKLNLDGEYQTLDFGTYNLTSDHLLYVAKTSNDYIEDITIDRLLLVRESK